MGAVCLNKILAGQDAFYNQKDYEETVDKELGTSGILKNVAYTYNTESKAFRIAKQILSAVRTRTSWKGDSTGIAIFIILR